jgi:hypothetical protein
MSMASPVIYKKITGDEAKTKKGAIVTGYLLLAGVFSVSISTTPSWLFDSTEAFNVETYPWIEICQHMVLLCWWTVSISIVATAIFDLAARTERWEYADTNSRHALVAFAMQVVTFMIMLALWDSPQWVVPNDRFCVFLMVLPAGIFSAWLLCANAALALSAIIRS